MTKQKKLNIEERLHGSASTYMKYKCRCAPCTEAATAAYALKNAKRNAKRAREAAKRIDAQRLVEYLSEAPPEIRSKYSDKFGGWTAFGIDVWTADKICIALETHPILVFGQMWIDKALEEEIEDNELVNV